MQLQELDTDKSGDVDFNEFITALEVQPRVMIEIRYIMQFPCQHKQIDPESEDVIKYAFERFDTDGSGLPHCFVWVLCLVHPLPR